MPLKVNRDNALPSSLLYVSIPFDLEISDHWTDLVIAKMISHATLYSLANSLGVLAMVTVVGYHFVAINAKYLSKEVK